MYLRDVNWLDNSINKSEIRCAAKIRSTQEERSGLLSFKENSIIFKFDDEIITTAPGQACVFYLKNQVLGGGWIVKNLN